MGNRLRSLLGRFRSAGGFGLLAVLLVTASFRSAVADWNDIPSGSMRPTLLEGDRIFVNKIAYDLKVPFTTWHLAEWDDPARGDVVIFFSPADGMRLVKRVVGLPGDVVVMRDNRLILNGQPVVYHAEGPIPDESTALLLTEQLPRHPHPVQVLPDRPSLRSFGPIFVPEGQYLMLGDNRDNSADSRYFGFVSRELIVGRVVAVVASLDPDRNYLPRSDRFLRPIE